MPRPAVLVPTLVALWFFAGTASLSFADHHKENDEGVALFDGKSIDEWVQRGGQAVYAVEDGAIVGTAVPKTPNSFLCTPVDYSNFELTLEFKVDPRLNSGVMFRAQSKPDYKKGRVHGYQAEIDPSDRSWTGGIYDEARRGWLNTLEENAEARAAFKADDWNTYRIRAEGDHLRTWINGVPAADMTDSKDASGFIGLQVHGIKGKEEPAPPMQVRWRNIRLVELGGAKKMAADAKGSENSEDAEGESEEVDPKPSDK